MKNKIYLTNDQEKIPVNASLRGLITRAVNRTLESEDFSRPAEVSVTFTDNEKIHELNKKYRGVDTPTDVLSFPIFDDDFDDGESAVLGDIVISLERAKAQADEYGHSFEREAAFLTIHSVLHLLGYDHMKPEDEQNMITHQKMALTLLGFEK